MKKRLLMTMGICIGLFIIAQPLQGQSLKKRSKSFVAAIHNSDVDALMKHYGDSIHYVDPIYGSDDVFAHATLRSFFEPMFAPEGTADVRVTTVAIDEADDSMILKGTSYDQTEKGRLPFAVYFKFEKGKIVYQMDFPVYAVESLKASPRYKPFMKD